MPTATQRRLEAVEKQLGELTAEKERAHLRGQVWDLEGTIANEAWWDSLDPDQYQEALKYMKAANEIMCARIGMSLNFVTHTWER